MASQVGDFNNPLELATGGYSTPSEFIRTTYGYHHDFLGEH